MAKDIKLFSTYLKEKNLFFWKFFAFLEQVIANLIVFIMGILSMILGRKLSSYLFVIVVAPLIEAWRLFLYVLYYSYVLAILILAFLIWKWGFGTIYKSFYFFGLLLLLIGTFRQKNT